jgi:hypothetical protein
VTVFVLLAIPLNHAEWKTLAVGATSLRQTINGMIGLSLGTSSRVLAAMARVTLAVVTLGAFAAAVRSWRQKEGSLEALTGATLALTLTVLLAAHRWLHTPFPEQGAIFLIPLTVLPVTAIIFKRHSKPAQITLLGISAVLIGCYLTAFPFGMYLAGRQFAGGRIVAKMLRGQAGSAIVRVGASQEVEPILNYYRTRYGQANWQPIERPPLTGTYHYYVLTPADASIVEQRHLHVIYRDGGLTLAQ